MNNRSIFLSPSQTTSQDVSVPNTVQIFEGDGNKADLHSSGN
jgi:hypothetical protein